VSVRSFPAVIQPSISRLVKAGHHVIPPVVKFVTTAITRLLSKNGLRQLRLCLASRAGGNLAQTSWANIEEPFTTHFIGIGH